MGNKALLRALNTAAGKQKPATRATEAEPVEAPSAKNYREGRTNISAWLVSDYKVSLRALQVKFPQRNLQDLMEEALNDLFAKHDVPVVSQEYLPQAPAAARLRAPRREPH
jgi:hypothetical protein